MCIQRLHDFVASTTKWQHEGKKLGNRIGTIAPVVDLASRDLPCMVFAIVGEICMVRAGDAKQALKIREPYMP